MREKIVPIEVTPEMMKMLEICKKNKSINPELYTQYDVKRGLRDINGKGVLAGLTEIGEIHAYDTLSDGSSKPCDGKLYYHGYDVEDLIKGFIRDKRFGFEEVTYLLLFGELPNKNELDIFTKTLSHMRTIPPSFVRDIIMQAPSKDMMNALSRGVLTLYAYDDKADDVSLPNVLRQCLQLIAQFPLLSVYGYQAFKYYHENDSFIVHAPKPELSTAENILHMLRNDSQYTELEARILDIALILHAEHGGGNNSTFTCRVLTSSGTDAYAAYAGAISSLKGPRHGGANMKVMHMLEDFKENVKNWEDEGQVADHLRKVINKEANDHSGLVYGMGHAVYTLSDPREKILKRKAMELAKGKDIESEFRLLDKIETLTPEIFKQEKGSSKVMCANVDMYSGLVYKMLGIPSDLYTPLFAIARMAGWSAHRMEEMLTCGRIIRPAYKAIAKPNEYVPIDKR